MTILSIPLRERCYKTLIRCDQFNSDEKLRAVFAVRELEPYQNLLPKAGSPDERVNMTIAFLTRKDRVNNTGRPVFLIEMMTMA
jgi:hypothetical protein